MTPVNVNSADGITLTCNIGDLTTAVDVSWKDNEGNAITSGQGGYTIEQGTLISNSQESTLQITSIAEAASSDTTVTFKCAAKSTQYLDSETSIDRDIVVNILTFGKSQYFDILRNVLLLPQLQLKRFMVVGLIR